MEKLFIWIIIQVFLYHVNISQGQDSEACRGARRCGDCVVRGQQCVWCSQEDFKGPERCSTMEDFRRNGTCSLANITAGPVNEEILLLDKSLTDGNDTVPAVQLKPQHIRLKLKPNTAKEISIQYRVAKNFPVDLYFLSDPSHTMRNLKSQLALLANDIANAIGNLTTNYRFGFGATMEKVTLPFTHTSDLFVKNPCYSSADPTAVCAPPYSFRHGMTLAKNVSQFVKELNETEVTANFDMPEGCLDGIMQVLVCTDRIGWRNISRRLLIFTTDADFHFAGDGRLAGIVKPNDGKCHMDEKGEYTMSLEQDYPSVGQIVEKARESDITIIFAVRQLVLPMYRKLVDENKDFRIPGAIVAELKKDSSNILNITTDTYNKIRQSVSLKFDGRKNVQIETKSNCGRRQVDRRASCDNITIGESITFDLTMTLNIPRCPKDRNEWKEVVIINPEGLKEQIVIDVEYICECDCQKPGIAEQNSRQCGNGTGTYECGVCHCNEGWTGEKCDCDKRLTDIEACSPKQTRNTTDAICSDRGECTCGKCECVAGHSGTYCECNDRGCGTLDNPCSGNGVCKCGVCDCNDGFNGTDCSCPLSTEACENENGTICSGHGICECGRCTVCDEGYRGPTCSECKICTEGCDNNKDCAACVGFEEGKYTPQQCQQLCQHVQVGDRLERDSSNISHCQFLDSNDCYVHFTYQTVEDQLKPKVVVLSSKQDCPAPPADIMKLAIGISAGVFLVALILLLLWRLFATLYDSIEYSKFETEIKNPKWGFEKNPIYRECVTTVANPKYDATL